MEARAHRWRVPATGGDAHPRSVKNEQLTSIAIVASIAFGALIAILAIMEVESLDTVATIGGILLGLMWVLIGVTRRWRASA